MHYGDLYACRNTIIDKFEKTFFMNMISLRYKALKGGNFSIYLDYTAEGIRRYEFLKLRVSKDYSKSKGVTEADKDALALAETIRAKRQNELYHNTTFNTSVKQVNRSLINYIEEYRNQTGRDWYKPLAIHLKAFSKKPPLISDITPLFISRFTDYLLKHISRNTAISYVGRLGMFLNKAVQEGLLTENPCRKLKTMTRVQPERTFLTLDELRQLYENRCLANAQIEQAFLFACFTGLRISDVKALRTEDIRQEKNKDGAVINVLLIRPQKTRNTSGKLLKIPLSAQALLIIKEVKRYGKSELFFDNLPGKQGIYKALRTWVKRTKLAKKLHFHVSRHTFASLSLSCGMDIYTVSKLLGHSDIKITEIYLSLTDGKKQREIEKFPMFSFKSNK